MFGSLQDDQNVLKDGEGKLADVNNERKTLPSRINRNYWKNISPYQRIFNYFVSYFGQFNFYFNTILKESNKAGS
jgi:hypothetical protein